MTTTANPLLTAYNAAVKAAASAARSYDDAETAVRSADETDSYAALNDARTARDSAAAVLADAEETVALLLAACREEG